MDPVMRSSWRYAAWLGLLGGVGCAIRIPVDEPAWAVDRGPAETRDPALTAVAAAIDPGPQTPLRARMPAQWLVDVDARSAGEDPHDGAEQELRVALLMWRELGEAATGERAVLAGLGRAVARAEAVAATGSPHPELLVTLVEAYAAIGAAGADASAMYSGSADDAARRLLRRSAAVLLRHHAAHPGVPDVLAAVADAALHDQDFVRAAELRRIALERLGERAGPETRLALAAACYQALELACGDAALGWVRGAADAKLQPAIDEVAWLGEQARAVTSAKGEDLEAHIDRAQRLRALGRLRDARTELTAAEQRWPDDARPRVGLASLALLRGEPVPALAQLQAARALSHRDRSYHELAIALLWPRLHETGEPRARALAELQALADGYRRFEPARAGVLALLLAALAEQPTAPDRLPALRGLARGHTQVAALVRQFPDSADARRLAYMTAQVAPTAAAALALVREPLTPALARDRPLQELQLETWFDLAVRWDRRGELPAIADAIAKLPADAGPRRDLLATTLAARATLAGQQVPEAASEIFTRISEDGAPADRARALSNLAVLDAAAGSLEQAMTRWTAALGFDHAVHFIRLNVAGALVRHESPPRAELAELLTTLAKDAETSELELLALAWRSALADKLQLRGGERAALTAKWKAWRAASPGAPVPGLWGIVAAPPRIALAYSDDRVHGHDIGGLTLTAEVDRVYWLVLSPHGRELPTKPRTGASAPNDTETGDDTASGPRSAPTGCRGVYWLSVIGPGGLIEKRKSCR